MIVDLLPDEDQTLLVDAINEVLRRCLPIARLREAGSNQAGAERRQWQDWVQLGLFGLGIEEKHGGIGYGMAEQVLAGRSLGRVLASPTILATLLAAHLAAQASDDAVLRHLCRGDQRAAFATPVAPGEVQIIDGIECDWLVLLGDHTLLVPTSDVRRRRPVDCLDESLLLERATLDTNRPTSGAVGFQGSLLLAAYLVGIAHASLDMAVEYAKTRQQFGQPIGAFQAIKHYCAEMLTQASAAEAQTFYAAVTGDDLHGLQAAAAFLLASQAAVNNAKLNIQIHGAMGFTAECNAHLLLKRAQVMRSFGGDPRARRTRILSGSLA